MALGVASLSGQARFVPVAWLQGLGVRTAAVLALRSLLTLGISVDCLTFADAAGDLFAGASALCALSE